MKNRGAALVRAFGALMVTGALVVGVPVVLISTVGNPLPSEWPTANEIRILLTQNGQGFSEFLMGTLAVLIWIMWAQLMIALVVEVVATVRHIETPRLRIFPGLQGFAARLVAAITLATALAAGPLIAPAVGALSFNDQVHAPASSALVVDVRSDGPPSAGASVRMEASQTRARSVDEAAVKAPQNAMTVSDHTELWDLADAAYGDGMSWKRIAAANAGAIDADGMLITSDTESVASGTSLVLPGAIDNAGIGAFGNLVERSGVPAADAEQDSRHVEAGDSMWSIAEDRVASELGRPGTEAEVAAYWADVVASNQDVASGNVDLIYPGDTLELPGEGAPLAQHGSATSDAAPEPEHVADTASAPELFVIDGPTGARTAAESRVVGTNPAADAESQALHEQFPSTPQVVPQPSNPMPRPAPAVPSPASAQADTSHNQSSRAPALGLVGLGTAMLSAGVISAVRRRRDVQRRTRPQGTIAPITSAEAAAFEAAILHASHELKESTQGLGWRAMPASTVTGLRAAGPIEIHARASGELVAVEVRATTGACPHDETVPGEWLPQDGAAESEQSLADLPMVAMSIIIGTDTTSGDAVLLDLLPASSVNVRGEQGLVRRFIRSVVLDLAVSDRADDVHVVAVGVGGELDGLERVHTVESYADALGHIIRAGHGSVDSETPVVVLSTIDAADATEVDKLAEVGATVVACGAQAPVTIDLQGDLATIEPSGTVARIAAFDDDEYRAASELVDATSTAAIELVDRTVTVEQVLDVATATACAVEPGPIELKILGPVEVSGAAPFSSLKAVDVIAYLAFHRNGVDADQIKSWVWPPFDPPTDKALANVMSRARTGLGASEDGEPYLSRAGADKTYRLSPEVTTDFDRVRALAQLADEADDDISVLRLLKQALDLIRGVPFTGGAASSFAWADNHVRAQVEYTIDELVHRCADLALDLGELDTARWAALKGLELVPGCEQCFRRRFLVAGAGNNRSELRRAMADLEAAAMVDLGEPEAVDSISGELLDLYNELDRSLVAGTS